MPVGEFLAEVVAQAVGEVLISGVWKVIAAVLRFPSALIGWAIGRKRTFRQVWSEGNAFMQGCIGLLIHATWITALVVALG